MSNFIETVLVYAFPVLFAVTLHEAAHAFVAMYFGDDTAYMIGRVSLNPFKHLDVFGTIIMPILLYFVTNGAILFGYAKPIPFNFHKLHSNSSYNVALVAIAGPLANLVMAFFWTILVYIFTINSSEEIFLILVGKAGVLINLVMFSFNLCPIPPLDGSLVLKNFLPNKYACKFVKIEPYGLFIIMILIILNAISFFWIAPVMYLGNKLIQLLTSIFFLFLT